MVGITNFVHRTAVRLYIGGMKDVINTKPELILVIADS